MFLRVETMLSNNCRPLSDRLKPLWVIMIMKVIESGEERDSVDTKLTIEAAQKLVNEILPGLQMFARDVDLSADVAAKYVPGMIIKELGFTDASCRVMGMVKTHRFAILSNQMKDISAFEHGTNWGLCVANAGAYYKVLDVYTFKGRTQILLLQLPYDERWKLFRELKLMVNGKNLEETLITECRTRFENKSQQKAVPELTTKEWLSRCEWPLGMDGSGTIRDYCLEE